MKRSSQIEGNVNSPSTRRWLSIHKYQSPPDHQMPDHQMPGIRSHKDSKSGAWRPGRQDGQINHLAILATLATFRETKDLRTMPKHHEGHAKVTKPQKMHYGLHYLQY